MEDKHRPQPRFIRRPLDRQGADDLANRLRRSPQDNKPQPTKPSVAQSLSRPAAPAPNHVSHKKRNFGLVMVGLALIVAITAGYLWFSARNSLALPRNISSQAKFTIFYPADSSAVKINKASINYDSQSRLLRFSGQTPEGNNIDFREQATPASSSDVLPGYYSLLERLHQYYSFNMAYGAVGVTSPQDTSIRQSARLYSRGTLLTAQSLSRLSKPDWQRVFSNLKVVQP
jgi:hypothetical protein